MTPSVPDRGPLRIASHIGGRREARRLSRRLARVGAGRSPEQIRQMLAGSPASHAEVCDFTFAVIATQYRRDQFRRRVRRMKRRGARSLLVVGMVLVTLNFLFCMAWALFNLTLDSAPL